MSKQIRVIGLVKSESPADELMCILRLLRVHPLGDFHLNQSPHRESQRGQKIDHILILYQVDDMVLP